MPHLKLFTSIEAISERVYKRATNSIRLDQNLIKKATIIAKAINRTPSKQIEHWAKKGDIMEDNPDLTYEFVKQAIIAKAERKKAI